MDEIETKVDEPQYDSTDPSMASSTIRQEVEEIKEAVDEVVSESSITDKVEKLRAQINNISEEMQDWRAWQKDSYLEALEAVKKQVSEVESEWDSVSDTMKAQGEKLESLLVSFPGVIETSTLRALSLRVTHLEKLVSQLVGESQSKSAEARAKKQLVISFVALGVTIVLWAVWIGLALLK